MACKGEPSLGDGCKEETQVDGKSGVARVLFKESSNASSGDDEVKIVYEVTVSPEERDAALKLKLPANFYSYRRAPPCAGCQGCEQDDTSDEPDKEDTGVDIDSKPAAAQPFWQAAPNIKPCTFSFGDSNAAPSATSMFGGKSLFGGPSSTGSIFGGTAPTTLAPSMPFATTTAAPVFGSKSGSLSIFGGAPAITPAPAPVPGGNTATNSIFGGSGATFSKPLFGLPSSNPNAPPESHVFSLFSSLESNTAISETTPTFGSVSSTPVFANVTPGTTPSFGSVISGTTRSFDSVISGTTASFGAVTSGTAPSFGSVTSGTTPNFGNVSSTTPSFGSVSSTTPGFGGLTSGATPSVGSEASQDAGEAIPFLPTNSSLSFAEVASQAKPVKTVIQDSSKPFQFAGAGSQVFGSPVSETDKSKSKPRKGEDGGSSGDEGDAGHDDAHDPQFAPVIPLPDAIEVRTGEEDEEKLFCERAKVFRYTDKEWKERGVGEMKILYHPGRKTYRLLLRRDQVYKVVLNQPLTMDLELSPLSTSETAWCWGGLNYAEEPEGNLEKLAVRFKNVELAKNFKAILESCQEKLSLNTSAAADQEEADVLEESGNSPSDESNNEDDPDQVYNCYIDPSDFLSYDRLFEESGDLEENYDGTSWKPLGEATASLVVDPETRMGSIVVKKDETVVCQTAQSEDDIYTVNGNYFEWTSFDLSVGSHRTLRISLPSEEVALDFKTKLECVVSAEGELEEEEEEEEEDDDEDGEWQTEE